MAAGLRMDGSFRKFDLRKALRQRRATPRADAEEKPGTVNVTQYPLQTHEIVQSSKDFSADGNHHADQTQA
jgi:hypothetical protein